MSSGKKIKDKEKQRNRCAKKIKEQKAKSIIIQHDWFTNLIPEEKRQIQ